jgi:hypothetical protein
LIQDIETPQYEDVESLLGMLKMPYTLIRSAFETLSGDLTLRQRQLLQFRLQYLAALPDTVAILLSGKRKSQIFHIRDIINRLTGLLEFYKVADVEFRGLVSQMSLAINNAMRLANYCAQKPYGMAGPVADLLGKIFLANETCWEFQLTNESLEFCKRLHLNIMMFT